ncbi:hypothetical protein [Flavobacterium algicola]|uniref:hypothetical protein n=1 Tax=Flavobacterium algicola TaxID=556529 RepID=UPI001EFE1E82|nr:hypothetical protein [Flavobacterium algicola]MCG9792126.1 hypothetical protein [Flavobacterium algicola]
MTLKKEQLKSELFHLLAYYSKYYFGQFTECESLYNQEKGHISLFYLLALLENIIKSSLNDFESTFFNLIKKLKIENLINETEQNFLNDSELGVRKIRNILAHANLSKYDLKLENELKTYPFTENETCLIIYERLSDIISGIIIKVIKPHLNVELEIELDGFIEKLDYTFITRTPEELMAFKAIPTSPIWDELDESTKYRLVEDSPDVNILTELFRNLKQ